MLPYDVLNIKTAQMALFVYSSLDASLAITIGMNDEDWVSLEVEIAMLMPYTWLNMNPVCAAWISFIQVPSVCCILVIDVGYSDWITKEKFSCNLTTYWLVDIEVVAKT